MPRLDFIPSRDGWHFVNSFRTRVLPGVLQGVKTAGLCGGMVMSALDYWRAKVPIPAHDASDLPPDADANGAPLPDEASRMRRYIFDRQMNSFLTRLMITRWLPAPWTPPDWFHDWAVNAEFNVVRQQVDRGRPAMLGLWGFADWNSGHQVLCYGYDTNPIRLYVYDPNNPDEESVLTPRSPADGVWIIGAVSGRQSQYRGYFWMDVYNWDQNPPLDPPYKDLALASGISTTPAGPDADLGGRLQIALTVRNLGEYPSRFKSLILWARDPVGNNIDQAVGGPESGFTALQPGEERTIVRDIAAFGQSEGMHTIGVARLTLDDHWQEIPPGLPGTVARRPLRLWRKRRLIIEKWVDVPESTRTDVDTSVTLQPGDEFELVGAGSIWAGVWGTGTNGPEGWIDRIERNPSFPMNSRPQAHPFALIGRFGTEAYFYIGNKGVSRRAYARTTPLPLMLRINDNSPSNGSGAFRCLVRVWR